MIYCAAKADAPGVVEDLANKKAPDRGFLVNTVPGSVQDGVMTHLT